MVKKIHIFLIAFFALTWSAAVPAMAQDGKKGLKPPVVAILDMRVVNRESKSGKAVQTFINAKRKTHKDLIAKEEKALRSAWEELSRQRSVLSAQAFQARERAFREKEAAAKRKIAGLEQQLQADMRGTLIEVDKVVGEKIRTIIDKIIAATGIDIIMNRQDLIYVPGDSPYNITSEVLRELDKALPTLNVQALANKASKKQP